MTARTRRAAAPPAFVALLALGCLVTPPAATAQGQVRLDVVAQSTWVAPDGTFVLELQPEGDVPADAELALSLHQRVTARSAFVVALDGDVGSVLAARTAIPLDEVPRGPGGTAVLTLPIHDGSMPGGDRVRLSAPGVYPVRAELRTPTGEVLSGLTTFLVRVPATLDGPQLAAALVVPVAAPPALQPDGTTALDPADRADLTVVAGALAARPEVPLTVQPVPETLEALRGATESIDAAVLAELAASLTGRQLLAGTYVSLDLTAWLDRERADEVVRQLQVGADVIVDVLEVRPDGRTWIGRPDLSPSSLLALAGAGVDQVVVPEEALSPVDRPLTLAEPFEVALAPGQTMRAAAADRGLAEHVPTKAQPSIDPVLSAQHVLADLAMLYFDSPSLPTGVVLDPPADWDPGGGFLSTLLGGLVGHPLVEPRTLDQLFREVPPAETSSGEPLVRTLEPVPPEPLGAFPAELDRTRAEVEAYGSMTSVADPLLASLRQRLLVTPAASFTGGQRRAYLVAVQEAIRAELSGVALPPEETVTLTARDAEIPLTITSSLDRPLEVRLSIEGDKLDFPDGNSQVVLLEQEKTTVLFAVEARASGTFTVDVRLDSPDGALTVDTTRVTVRSTAVSNLGLVLSIGAAVFLATWWVLHHRKTRRPRPRHARGRPQTPRRPHARV